MFKLIISDLDGPILNSLGRTKKSVLEGIKKLIQEWKLPPEKVKLSEENFIKYWGYPGLKTSELMFPNLNKEELAVIVDCWAKNELKEKIPLVKGALKTLKYLKKKGYFNILLTARSHNLRFHLKNYPLQNLFDMVVSWKNPQQVESEKIHSNHLFLNHHKPNPEVLNPILKWATKKGVLKEEMLMIDDTLVGLKTARAGDIPFLGVCTGPLNSKKAWQKYGNLDKKYVIKSIAELPSWLEKYERV